jgi:hypothetical protein
MTRAPVVFCCGFAIPLAGFGGESGTGRLDDVSVQIDLTTFQKSGERTQSFSLSCNPPAGTLSLAERVCEDIGLYPRTMLNPRLRLGPGLCFAGQGYPRLSVTATANGVKTSFGGMPGCGWPDGDAIGVYYYATQGDEAGLARFEGGVRCGEDPVWLMRPVYRTIIRLCRYGSGPSRVQRVIRIAKQAAAIAALRPQHLFPTDTGWQSCKITFGGMAPGKRLAGQCGVWVNHARSAPTVTFAVAWPPGKGTARHTWSVAVDGLRAAVVAEDGPVPPQLGR